MIPSPRERSLRLGAHLVHYENASNSVLVSPLEILMEWVESQSPRDCASEFTYRVRRPINLCLARVKSEELWLSRARVSRFKDARR